MKLTKPQIEQVLGCIKQKCSSYIDVQMEILDHVATSIEEKMTVDGKLNFDDALIKTRASFGVMGFSVMEDAIMTGLKRKYAKLFIKNFFSFFKNKYILLFVLIGYLSFKFQEILANKVDAFAIYISMCIIVYGIVFYTLFSKANRQKKIMANSISNIYLSCSGSFLLLIFAIIVKTKMLTFYGFPATQLAISILIPLLLIYIISALKTAKIGAQESKSLMEKYSILFKMV